jgi:CelD/BcsL family acetyltransferase involved in cellulose biosynthesis
MLHIELLDEFDEDKLPSALWDQIVYQGPKEVSLTYDWMHSLWESHYDRRPIQNLVLKDGSDIVGIFPFSLRLASSYALTLRRLDFLANPYSNHTDLILAEPRDDYFVAILDYLLGRRIGWDIIEFWGVSEDARVFHRFAEIASSMKVSVHWDHLFSSPFLPMSGTWQDFLETMNSKYRRSVKSRQRKLCGEAGASFRTFSDPQEVPIFLDEIYRIELQSWKQQATTSITSVPRQQKFYSTYLTKAARAKILAGTVCYLKEQPISYDMGLLYDQRYYLLKTSYDVNFREYHPGVVLRAHVLETLFGMGVREHDFLGKDESHKLDWTQSKRKHFYVKMYNPLRPVAKLASYLKTTKRQWENRTKSRNDSSS